MDRKRQRLIITLKSDLCTGSGYSYAGIVDSDVCYDRYGIPYIPAKRLKGCLRDAANMIGLSESDINRMFGMAGNRRATGVLLGNAYIEGYKELYNELKSLDSSVQEYMTPQNILDQFTTIKAQTRIMENGVAKDNSLRYIRTIDHYSPMNREQELQFGADVCYAELEERIMDQFENVVKALRSIGLNRNRGLGSVKCELMDTVSAKPVDIDFSKITDDEDTYVLTYSVKNVEPLVLSANYDYLTERYISGQVVMGCLAGAYLEEGNSGDSPEFEELFLKDQVIFSGLYPQERPAKESSGDKEAAGNIFYPAPVYINELKKTKKYVNVTKRLLVKPEDCTRKDCSAEYATGEGNQPKKMKGKFVCFKKDGILVKEVDSDIVYHHAKNSKKQEAQDEELLYSFETIREGQDFSGSIIGQGKYIRKLGHLLQHGELRFGKSKSSQYGKCVLNGVPQIREMKTAPKSYPAGSRILVFLQSDGIFVNETGYTVRCEQVREQIREKLKIKEKGCTTAEAELYSEIETKMLTGYYTKWNLKRQAVLAVCAGSAFEYELAEKLEISEKELYAGIRIGEGYGRLAVIQNDGEDFRIQKSQKESFESGKLKYAKSLLGNILLDEMKEQLRREAVKSNISVKNPAALGRITLMLSESVSQCPNKPDQAYTDFCKRIGSIKTKATEEQMKKIKNDWICEEESLSVDRLKYISKIQKWKAVYEENLLCAEDSAKRDEFNQKLKNLWSDYLMAILVQEKYNIKLRECQKDNSSES